jgi:hypothetical protein
VLLLGVSVLQFLERVPDRQAVDLVKYHIGWKHALAQELEGEVFDPTVLVRFRERRLEHAQGQVSFEAVLGGLKQAGLVKQKGRQRLDSTHVLAVLARMGRLECVRESLRLALDELAGEVGEGQRPEFWHRLWERYLDSQPDYQASSEALKQKMTQVGDDLLELRTWLTTQPEAWRQGEKVQLLERVWSEQFEVTQGQQVVRKAEIPATPVPFASRMYFLVVSSPTVKRIERPACVATSVNFARKSFPEAVLLEAGVALRVATPYQTGTLPHWERRARKAAKDERSKTNAGGGKFWTPDP